jgi:hypothetical protein
MGLFVVTAPATNAKIGPAIEAHFPDQHIQAWQGHWFISAQGTAKEIATKLDIPEGGVGTAIVVSVTNYWGRANPDVWEWVKSRQENK